MLSFSDPKVYKQTYSHSLFLHVRTTSMGGLFEKNVSVLQQQVLTLRPH